MNYYGVKSERLVKEIVFEVVEEVAFKRADKRIKAYLKKSKGKLTPSEFDVHAKFFEEEREKIWVGVIRYLFEKHV